MINLSRARVGLAVAVAVGITATGMTQSQADPAPQPKDVVGVGSDIVQNSMDFLADGYGTDPGYNTVGNRYRLISFDASGDANGRKEFSDPSLGTSTALNPTVTLRAGTSPVQRPNGGGTGLTALINDGTGGVSANRISFARSPNLPTAAQLKTATANLGTSLHTVEIAQDEQVIATAATTNAPSALSAQDLVQIYEGNYTTWGQIPGYDGPAPGATIHPLIPQNGAGVQTVFLNALKAANGGNAISPDVGVQVQQNDPTTITGPNDIVPFPVGRYTLFQKGYFRDPNTAYNAASPPPALSASNIKLQLPSAVAKAGDGNPTFDAAIPYYVIFRQSDLDSTTPWQPGSTLNWVQELFSDPDGPAPYVDTAPAQQLLTDIGLTPKYVDLGITSNN